MSPVPAQQKALVLTRKHGDFELVSWPVPHPRHEEVLVKVEAAALNPVDSAIPIHGLFVDEYPMPLGVDIAGEVVGLGPGVTAFSIGDKVFFEGTYFKDEHSNGFQQYALADVHTLSKYPTKLTPAEASTLPVALTAAYLGFYNPEPHGMGLESPLGTPSARGRYNGSPIVVIGGPGSVGQAAIQFARISGFGPIIATSSLKHAEYLKTLGATHVLDRSLPSEALQAAVEDIISTSTLEVNHVFDAIATAETQQLGLDLVAPGGKLVVVLDPVVTPKEERKVFYPVGLKHLPMNVEIIKTLWTNVYEFLETGDLKPNRLEVLPGGLAGVVAGLERLRQKQVSAQKLVVLPQETL